MSITPETTNVKPLTQGTQSNGYYDAELKVIVLGWNMNTMTLPHEMAHFWLDNTFSMFKKASKGELTIGQQKPQTKAKTLFVVRLCLNTDLFAITSNLATKTRLTHDRTAKRRTSPPQNNTFFALQTQKAPKNRRNPPFFSFFSGQSRAKITNFGFFWIFFDILNIINTNLTPTNKSANPH